MSTNHKSRLRIPTLLLSLRLLFLRCVGLQVDPSETRNLKGMYFQLVDNQVLSTQGQPDVNLHRLTWRASFGGRRSNGSPGGRDVQPALVIGRHYVTERDSAPVQYNGVV